MLNLRTAVLALTLTTIGLANAQDKKPDQKKPDEKKPTTKLKGSLPANFKKLGLRDDQVQEIYKIRSDAKAKLDELRAKLEKLRADEKAQIEKVLTPAQLERLREIRTGEKSGSK